VLSPSRNRVFDKYIPRLLIVSAAFILGTGLLIYMISHVVGAAFISLAFYTAMAAALLPFISAFRVPYTILTMSPAPKAAGKLGIRIMDDANHDVILKRIRENWRDRPRAFNLAVRPENGLQKERARFFWLKDNGVISEEEHASLTRALERMICSEIGGTDESGIQTSLN
jgi:hypothetical protein